MLVGIYIKFQSFKVYFNNIPEGLRPMCIYTMYAGMSTGKYNDKQFIYSTLKYRHRIVFFSSMVSIVFLQITMSSKSLKGPSYCAIYNVFYVCINYTPRRRLLPELKES